MHRCQESAGRYRVEFAFLDSNGEEVEGEYIAPLGPHENIYLHSKMKDVFQGYDAPMGLDAMPDPRWELIEAVPRVSQQHPYVGELCAHELAFVKSLPGKLHNGHWRYTVQKEA